MASDSKKSEKKSEKPLKEITKEEILLGFQTLRNEQRGLANKLTELEMDLNEHRVVIETLKHVDDDRKCFRMIGGILCERTVKDVMPVLVTNKEQLTNVIGAFNTALTKKGVELNEYKEKHKLKIRGQDDDDDTPPRNDSEETPSRGTVLVANP